MRRARLAGGLTLDQVLERLGRPITKAGLSKYELGKSAPDADFLLRFARVCEVPPSYFLAETPTKVEWLAYRRHARLGARLLERIRAFAEERLEAWVRLKEALHPSERPDVPPSMAVRTVEEAERAALRLRAAWGLGERPIENLCATLEHRGWVLVGWRAEDGFDGLSGHAEATPVVVLNLRDPSDRRRLALAHEVGHLLLRSRAVGPKEEEALMHAFARAFLAPAGAVRRELGNRRTRLDLEELALLKREWGLSMQGWLRRAAELEIVPQAEFRRWKGVFRARGWDREEPVADRREEEPSRLRHMASAARAEGVVEEAWARRFCPEAIPENAPAKAREEEPLAVRLMRLPPERRRPFLMEAAERAAATYSSDPELTEFNALDGEDFEE
ncbi:MAG TPA: XRE family transcriptional regulator [Planctomycetota bacterium]|nr:XRE family transcriptional regulator [Planctomycetota bacterium]